METPSHFPGFFDVELKIGPLDHAAELLDAQAARLRYMTRRQWSESSEQAPNPSTAIFSAQSSTVTPVMRSPGQSRSGAHFQERYAAQPVPVHSDRGPDLVVQDPGYDQFLTTSMATKARGKYYTLWDDYIYLRPQRRPPPEADPKKAWVQLMFGVAHEVSFQFQYSPASGILGLGRRMNPDDVNSAPPTFQEQVQGRLQSPEFAILLTDTIGFITFGRRAVFEPTEYPWHTYLPLLGNDHWKVASTVKELNGIRYAYEGGEAELDTGTAICYLNQNFVDAFYSCIPGFVVGPAASANATARPQNIYYIPVDSSVVPDVRLDIGGHMFTLELMHLPGGMKHLIGTKSYYIGAVQSKTVLYPTDSHQYDGPDLISRVALINMEVVFQMPYDKPHTISWRRKARNITGPAPTDWESSRD
ncbi:aspartic peptidase domain-containing protein [Mycena maculata]|uniref:Aspartic peptidase domain-containing protein n=1 Tax=Mycena maculata TaxID=230809 RepID=A0AAD7HIA3_9AGAR|nr:aspartic peptidase domain-containing protein [Mycena maculata]